MYLSVGGYSLLRMSVGSQENFEDLSLGRSSSPQVLTRTFLLTVSPREDVTLECQNSIIKYVREQCLFGYVVTENGRSGKLHLHAVMVFDSHREKKKLQENINNRVVKRNGHPDAKNGIATYVQVCPGHKWYDEYLRKEGTCNVLYDRYNREEVTQYFPTEAVQEFLQTHTRSSSVADKYMDELERKWIDRFPDDSSYECAIEFIKYRMFVQRDMICIRDKRKRCELAWTLYEYRNQIVTADVEERNYGNRMTGNFVKQ